MTASNTDLRLYKVSVREIDVTHGIPTDLSKTSSYNADQEVQLEFATKESEYTLYFWNIAALESCIASTNSGHSVITAHWLS